MSYINPVPVLLNATWRSNSVPIRTGAAWDANGGGNGEGSIVVKKEGG